MLLIGIFLVSSSVSASDTSAELQFDEEGKLKVDEEIENTYDMPDVSAGVGFDGASHKVKTLLALELFDDIYIENYPFGDTFKDYWVLSNYPRKIDVGVGEDLVFVSYNIRFTSIFEISAGTYSGWNFKENERTMGVNVLITKF